MAFTYELPKDRIANEPANPRDSAKLLVVNARTGKLVDDVVSNLPAYVPEGTCVVLNDTKVVPARIELTRKTGGKVEALLLLNEWRGAGPVPALLRKSVPDGEVLEAPGSSFTVSGKEEGTFWLEFSGDREELLELLDEHGETPLPPYIHSSMTEEESRRAYQPIFAENPASVAAPTASLHFTNRLLGALAGKGVTREFVTLHVGRGTFLPVSEAQLESGTLHEEHFDVPIETGRAIEETRLSGCPVLAVGTTVTRALESWARGKRSTTDLLIQPPFTFAVVDALMTNFHLPGSSLLCLVEAFLGWKESKVSIEKVYQHAIDHGYRFYSFGDAMLII